MAFAQTSHRTTQSSDTGCHRSRRRDTHDSSGPLTLLGRESLTQRYGKTELVRSISNASVNAIKLKRQEEMVSKRKRHLEGQMGAFSAGRLSVGGR